MKDTNEMSFLMKDAMLHSGVEKLVEPLSFKEIIFLATLLYLNFVKKYNILLRK